MRRPANYSSRSWTRQSSAAGTKAAEFLRIQLGILVSWLSLLAVVSSNAAADERDDVIERLAVQADSASGLLAAGHPQKFLGARSCAASACHGGIDPDPRFPLSRRNEYVHWLDKDPHSRSYQTLQNDLSKAILARLSRATDDDEARAKRLANCFGCHNPQPARPQQAETFYERDAASCEICHGPAEKWIGPHVTAAWPGLKATGEAATLGFNNTEDINTRAQTCAACHVGSPGREVNHDLIAAGHPALKFELAAYHAMLPKHWRDDGERETTPQLEIQLWQAGQVKSGEAAIELLKWRAQRSVDDSPDAVWPEFAEYECFACHHDLIHPSWRQTVPKGRGQLGMPTWGSWYFSRFKQPAKNSLQSLATEMQSSYRPDPTVILDAAGLVRLAAPPIDVSIDILANWDDATQQYLALLATEQAQRDARIPDDPKIRALIENLREKQLAFPEDYDSPKGAFDPGDAFRTREQILESLKGLWEQLQQRGKE